MTATLLEAPVALYGNDRPEPRIRIAFVIDHLSRAGTESQLLALLRTLDRRIIEPTLILLNGTAAESRALEPAGCPIHRLGVTKLFSRSAWSAGRSLLKLWQRDPPDIVQAYFMDSAYFAVPIAKRAGVRRIVRVRNNLGYWLTAKHRLLGRILKPWIDVTLTNTQAGKTQLVERERIAADRVAVIENGVDLDRFPRRMTQPGSTQHRIGCVANLRPVKNVDGLLRAAARVADRVPDVQIEIAGDGEQRPELERLLIELNLQARVRLLGSVSNVPGFLASLDVAVLPSHSEGMSNALLEYMAAGCAIVATDVGANAQLVQHHREGLIVPPGNELALAEAMIELLQRPVFAQELGHAARERVEREYSRQAMQKRFEQFYRDLVRRT